MPTYEYMCKKCGPFTEMRPMAECDLPSDCPECGASAPRVLLTAPGCLSMSAEARQAGAKYERSTDGLHDPPPYLRDRLRPHRDRRRGPATPPIPRAEGAAREAIGAFPHWNRESTSTSRRTAPRCSRRLAGWAWRASCRSASMRLTARAGPAAGSRRRTPTAAAMLRAREGRW
jgi:putative FmdB family regulatory protein